MSPLTGGLLVAGTASDVGKSLVTAGLCRCLARRGVEVAPFKAQNMSNNSMVCADGAEIGRAQWLQAIAAGVEPEAAMNPVLLKPGSDLRSHVVLMGKPYGDLEASTWTSGRAALAQAAYDAFADLRSRFDVVVAEGAGSPTEVNLRDGDYVNMGFARATGLPVVVVADIDRGGALAAMYGTLALLSAEDQALLAGWIVNKFRGDRGLLQPGLEALERVTGRLVLGVLPWLRDTWIDAEDRPAVSGWTAAARDQDSRLTVAVVRLPRASNTTDVDGLAVEPGVVITTASRPEDVASADVVVVPGSRATVHDLAWLRERGLADAIVARCRAGRPTLGICGGYQMLAGAITDPVESGRLEARGLGLLPIEVTFGTDKVVQQVDQSWRGEHVSAYLIHHGVATLDEAQATGTDVEPFLGGFRSGAVWGTPCHGIFENDPFRRRWLAEAATQAGVDWAPAPDSPSYAGLREQMLERVADAIDAHVDIDRLLQLIAGGAPADLPFVPPGAP